VSRVGDVLRTVVCWGAIAGVLGCASNAKAPRRSSRAPLPMTGREGIEREPLKPLPPKSPEDVRVVALGRKLFQEKRLSSDGTVSCSSCHDIANGGDDGRPRSVGVKGRLGNVNAPTVLNASLNFALFWNGRAKSLEEQLDGPVLNPAEMNTSWVKVVATVAGDSGYARMFSELYPEGVEEQNVRSAIATYERTLLTRGSAFDRWLEGDQNALTGDQTAGYEVFKSVGCVACHQGQNVGGNMFQRFGILGDYFKDRGSVTEADLGRFGVTGNESDRFVFRVPSLRNVERTAPYFHDGSAPTLERAVQVMAKYQLGRTLTPEQVAQVVAFLKSLTGPIPDGAVEHAG
jgi:cytochrome c peroxidase